MKSFVIGASSSLVIEPEPALKWTINEPSELQSKVHQLARRDLEEDHDRHECEPLKPTYGQPKRRPSHGVTLNIGSH